MTTLQKVKEYYKNSPRRIGWACLILHLIITICLANGLIFKGGMSVVGIPFVVYFFPIVPFLVIFVTYFYEISSYTKFFLVVFPTMYYLLLFITLFKVNTSSKIVKILQIIFLIWFLISLFFSIQYILGAGNVSYDPRNL